MGFRGFDLGFRLGIKIDGLSVVELRFRVKSFRLRMRVSGLGVISCLELLQTPQKQDHLNKRPNIANLRRIEGLEFGVRV